MTKEIEEKTYNDIISNVVATRQGTTVVLFALFWLVLCSPMVLWVGPKSLPAVVGLLVGLEIVVFFTTELQFFASSSPIRMFLSAALVHSISAAIVTLSVWNASGAVPFPFVGVISLVASFNLVLQKDWLEIN